MEPNQPLSTNRCSIQMGYQFDYVQALAAKLGIDDATQTVAVIILDHIRLIGLNGASTGGSAADPSTRHETVVTEKPLPDPDTENLLEGMLPALA